MPEPITTTEWLSELERLSHQAPIERNGFLTAAEIAEARTPPCHTDAVRKLLRIAMKAGRLEMQPVGCLNISGRVTRVPAYRIGPADKVRP